MESEGHGRVGDRGEGSDGPDLGREEVITKRQAAVRQSGKGWAGLRRPRR